MAKGSKTRKTGPSGGYTVLARRYRSREFDELVGQDPIARTLKNAIAAGRTAHAYLFCGTRGVGKTSMARIFAKALNVTDDLAEAEAIREAILRGDDLDVIEIDGASNRGIQEAKDLIAGAGLSPARCPYKIYIIDEVHMLTTPAFNALLKTMEEPPAHVKFILCTTEAHKVPPTIQSRCQRFDFRTIPTVLIAGHLRHILEKEKVAADDAVISQIARLGNGSMRDALSLLDRLLAAAEEKLTSEVLEQMLGLPDQSLVASLVEAVAAGDAPRALQCGNGLLNGGATIEQALHMLTEHFRTLMIIAACGSDGGLLDLPTEAGEAAAAQSAHFDAPALVHLIALCDATARNARGSATARALFDALLVRLCAAEHLADIASLLEGATGSAAAGKKKERVDPVAPPASRPDLPAAPTAPMALAEAKPQAAALPVSDDQLWSRVVEAAAASPPDQAKVRNLRFESFDGRTLRLTVAEEGVAVVRFLRTQTDALADLVERATGRSVRIELDSSRAESGPPAAVDEQQLAEAQKLPLVRKAMDLFDAVVVEAEQLSAESSPAPGAADEAAGEGTDHV
ncbi:MAG: DNA polymerase III subunit gamma/tau [Phycisphaerales bacterium]|nr:MAG: DNA polymerase III subunit gamma/tau [Phycisphaerales bacterium]